MSVKRMVFWLWIVLLVAGGIVIGVVTVRGMGSLREINASIGEARAALESVEKERTELAEAVRLEREKMSQVPDSLAARKPGAVMKAARSFAKMEAIIDRKEERSKRSLEILEEEKELVRGRLIDWNVKLGGIELILLAGLIGVRRMLR